MLLIKAKGGRWLGLKFSKDEPIAVLQELILGLQIISKFRSAETRSEYFIDLEQKYQDLLKVRRSCEKRRVSYLRSSSHFIKNLDESERTKRETTYLRLRNEAVIAQENLSTFEKNNMSSMQEFKKLHRAYEKAQRVITSHTQRVAIFTYFELFDSKEIERYFMYLDGMRELSPILDDKKTLPISTESAIGKSSLGKYVGDSFEIVLSNGSVREVEVRKITVPSEYELMNILQENIKGTPPKIIKSEIDFRENRNHRDRHRTPY
jgi:hypothetical protein